jgi:hypothetical protein
LQVHSPIAGVITSWELRKKLDRRPVKLGQILMEVADPKGGYELEILMPEDRIGHIESSTKGTDVPLRVTYFLATDPGTELEGEVLEIEKAAEVRGEEGNTIKIRVKIKQEDVPPHSRPGAGVTAKVYCGKRPIGYVWFHDVIEAIQSRILFRF